MCEADGCDRPVMVPKHGLCRRCYQRGIRKGTVTTDPQEPARRDREILPGDIGAMCWCEAVIVSVSPEEVRAGRTRSCGAPGCDERVMA